MTIALGSDHVGYAMKNELKAYLESKGHTVTDLAHKVKKEQITPFSVRLLQGL